MRAHMNLVSVTYMYLLMADPAECLGGIRPIQ